MGEVIYPVTRLEQIAYATVLIRTEGGSGTGFLLEKKLKNGKMIPLLVTNKHVIQKKNEHENIVLSETGTLIFHASEETIYKPSEKFTSIIFEKDFGKHFVLHPNPNIDLCALNLAAFINAGRKIKPEPFITYIPTSLIPTEDELRNLDYMEDIIMVGYPQALLDNVHNYPIMRKGVTATHPYIDFDGQKEFLADIATYSGSSGSPIFLTKRDYIDKKGCSHIGDDIFYFMGIVYSVETSGIFIDVLEPIKLQQEDKIRISMNLAHVIKSSELYELLKQFKD